MCCDHIHPRTPFGKDFSPEFMASTSQEGRPETSLIHLIEAALCQTEHVGPQPWRVNLPLAKMNGNTYQQCTLVQDQLENQWYQQGSEISEKNRKLDGSSSFDEMWQREQKEVSTMKPFAREGKLNQAKSKNGKRIEVTEDLMVEKSPIACLYIKMALVE